MDARKRMCKVVAKTHHNVKCCLRVRFPLAYPYNEAPSFSFIEGTTLDPQTKNKILKVIGQEFR